MREIIYVQAGTLANYTGTHFWNTQETYLFDTTVKDSLTNSHDPDVSFREGLSQTVCIYSAHHRLRYDHFNRDNLLFARGFLFLIEKARKLQTFEGDRPLISVYIANFGTLAKTNALLGTNEDDLPDEGVPAIWSDNPINC